MYWNTISEIEIKGRKLVIKDSMIMLSNDEDTPEWPYIDIEPGLYTVEINVKEQWYCNRIRVLKVGKTAEVGNKIGSVEVDHGSVGIIDYEMFLSKVKEDTEDYEEWTSMKLDDEIFSNFSGEIDFKGNQLVYVKSGDGDGTYPVYELKDTMEIVGLECVFNKKS